jgi:hypothetical protein
LDRCRFRRRNVPVPKVDVSIVDPAFLRSDDVDYPTCEPVGALVVDTAAKDLYHADAPCRAGGKASVSDVRALLDRGNAT